MTDKNDTKNMFVKDEAPLSSYWEWNRQEMKKIMDRIKKNIEDDILRECKCVNKKEI